MKLLILTILIALSTATWMQSNQQFLQLTQQHQDDTCGLGGGIIGWDVSTCGCQTDGCAFHSTENRCVKVMGQDDPNIFSAGILGMKDGGAGCNHAKTQDACLSHVAWTNRFGGKTDCAWCSTVCVSANIADHETCDIGGQFTTWSGNPTVPVALPASPTVPGGGGETGNPETPNIVQEIEDAIVEEGGLSGDQVHFGV